MNIYQPIINIIKDVKRLLIASHAHPDGDGIGSTIALAISLQELGKEVVMFNTDGVPYNLKFLPFSSKIVNRLEIGARFDATLLVDCSERKRVGGDVAKIERDRLGKIILIDHHISDKPDSDASCIDYDAAATGEVVYGLLREIGIKITPEIATLLFCTFVVDSGSFRYSNTSSRLMRDAAALIDVGASPWEISKELDESNPPSYIKLLRLMLSTFDINERKNVAWVVLTQQMFEEAGASLDVAEEFINFPRSIAGVEVAILFRESPDGKWKISFRSKDKVDVRKIAVKFDGGGHAHAAGCTLEGNLASVKARIFKEVNKCFG